MEALAKRVVDGLREGRGDAEALALAGDPDPPRAAEAFARAASDPDLAGAIEVWAPALLVSARPGFGAQSLAELAERRRAGGSPLDVARAPAVPRVLASSNFLARILLSNPGHVDLLDGATPAPAESEPISPGWDSLRDAKYRALLRIAARDLGGVPFPETLEALSSLADRCLVSGLASAAEETGGSPPALFALGKLGGRELNFSSDVDLLFVYEPPPGADDLEHNREVSLLIQRLKTGLEARTAQGFGYRVDLDLRPEGRVGALANSVDAALSYYESFGAEWERQMLIRLRYVAGPREVGDKFASEIEPFVYRRLIDPGILRSVREMKARIEDERRRAGRDLEVDLKEGPGGIRDVEFLVQSFQLFFGGRHPEIRSGHVLETLDALAHLELLPTPVAAALRESYTWLRRAEHALQLPEEQQTARFPREAGAQRELCRRMGYTEPEAETARNEMLEDWTTVRSEVRAHFDALVLESVE